MLTVTGLIIPKGSNKLASKLNSGALRGEAAPAEPHTHTKRRAGKFSWSWQAEWIAGACAVRPSHFMTFLHNANFAQLPANDVRGIA